MRVPIYIILLSFLLALSYTAHSSESAKEIKKKIIKDIGKETASHKELEPLPVEFKNLSALCYYKNDNILACDADTETIKVISPEGKVILTMKPGFSPQAITVSGDGTIYCGGKGKIAKLDKKGTVLKTIDIPSELLLNSKQKKRKKSPRPRVSGIAVSDKDLFIAIGSGWSVSAKSKLFRFDLQLKNPKLLAEGMRGCCQRCDITFSDGILYLAENSAHRVVEYNRNGDVIGKWGKRSRTDLKGFGSCCNPMNLCFDSNGFLYTAESGIGRVKRYTKDGKFLGLIGYIGVDRFKKSGRLAATCSNIAIAVTPKGKRVYVMDYKNSCIRLLEKK